MSDANADKTLDCKGMSCPMPVLKTKKALDTMEAGQTLFVEATDKGFQSDLNALLRRIGHDLLESDTDKEVFTFLIKKK